MPRPDDPTSNDNDPRTWSYFVLLSIIWGSSFLFIKVGLDEGMGPVTLVTFRTLFGVLMLAPILLIRGGRLPLRWHLWKRLGFLGLTNLVVPFLLIAWGQQYIPSGMAAVLNGLEPLFTVLLAVFILSDESITMARLAGLGMGFLGVVLLALPNLGAAGDDADAVLAVAGMMAVAMAALVYAVAVVYSRRRLTGQQVIPLPDGTSRAPTPLEVALGSTGIAFMVMLPLAVVFERPDSGLLAMPGSEAAWLSVLWLGLLGTGLAYVLFFGILERWGATRTTVLIYVEPVVAIALGYVILHERLRPIEILGAILIFVAVVLMNTSLGGRRLPGSSTPEARIER